MSSRRRKKNLSNKTSIGTIAACSGAVGLFVGLGVATLMRSKVSPHKDNLKSDVLDDTNQSLQRRLKNIVNKVKSRYTAADQKKIEGTFDFKMYYVRCNDPRFKLPDDDAVKAIFDEHLSQN
jgi:hypothetical protein